MFIITEEWLKEFTKTGYLSQQKTLLGVGKNDTPDKIKNKVVDTLLDVDTKNLFELMPTLSRTQCVKFLNRWKADKKRDAYEKEAKISKFRNFELDNKFTKEFIASSEFLKTMQWAKLRMKVLVESEGKCECCGSTAQDGVKICVDHVKPRKFFPELALTQGNLQVLCDLCNLGKGNNFSTNWKTRTFVKRELPAEG